MRSVTGARAMTLTRRARTVRQGRRPTEAAQPLATPAMPRPATSTSMRLIMAATAHPPIRSVSLERPGGKAFWFSQWSGGAWQSEHDIDGSLSRTASGWSYTTRDGVTGTYDGSGRLAAMLGREGLN